MDAARGVFAFDSKVVDGAVNGSAWLTRLSSRITGGTDQGVKPGARFALFRDVKMIGMPLTSVGDAVVISTSSTMALTRITRARDAIVTGDYVVPRK